MPSPCFYIHATTLLARITAGKTQGPELFLCVCVLHLKPALDLSIISLFAQLLHCINQIWLGYAAITNDPEIYVAFNNLNSQLTLHVYH